ncbi:MAG: BsuBI/PstI family type II restriction endonuclease [Myxococcales bacterium]
MALDRRARPADRAAEADDREVFGPDRALQRAHRPVQRHPRTFQSHNHTFQSLPRPVQSHDRTFQRLLRPVQSHHRTFQSLPRPVQSPDRAFQSLPRPVQSHDHTFQSLPRPVQGLDRAFQSLPRPVQRHNRTFQSLPRPVQRHDRTFQSLSRPPPSAGSTDVAPAVAPLRYKGTVLRPSLARTLEAPPATLVDRTEVARLEATRRLDPSLRGELGQFLTPPPVARFMASLVEARGERIELLDPGAGVGSLTAAFVDAVASRRSPPSHIAVTACELDPLLAGYLGTTLADAQGTAGRGGTRLTFEIQRGDFIERAVRALQGGLFAAPPQRYDCAILNPPYHKIPGGSKHRLLLRSVGIETSNLYTAFLALVVRLLRPGGELVAITPRSFCNGSYFEGFRKSFLAEMSLRRLHVFETRDTAFGDDQVLQENLILHAVKSRAPAKVVVSASATPEDAGLTQREVEAAEVVRPDDPHRFIRLVADELGRHVERRMASFRATLAELGIAVSTGRVVDFRSAEALRAQPEAGTVPLVYPGHFSGGFVRWPHPKGRKPNALAVTPRTETLLLPSGTYVLVKRFSAKEEPRRVVAAVYDPKKVGASRVAFENHLNVYHRGGAGLPEDLARGLARFLNSSLVDAYFRQFSGHTQVNAMDLRSLPYPDRSRLAALGAHEPERTLSEDEIDALMEKELTPVAERRGAPNPIRAKKKIGEALEVLRALGLPREQQNERSALALLALAGLEPTTPWSRATRPLWGITPMMTFFAEHYGKKYKPNTRETVRRFTVHQFVQAGLVLPNPDQPGRPITSPDNVYQIEAGALELLRTFKSAAWEGKLRAYLSEVGSLKERWEGDRRMQRLPVTLAPGKTLELSPGGQNELVKKIVDDFCPRFTPGGHVIHVGDAGDKWAHFDEPALAALGVRIDRHGKMPDLVIHHRKLDWLVLIEAVTSHGPVNPKRREELAKLFQSSRAGLVYVTAFLSRRAMVKYLGDISWETEVWVAEAPDHMIHFNGERFLGPY